MRVLLNLLLFLALPSPALADDGVLGINATCAVQTGRFAGDTPGYPVTLSQPGSYRLTSNLVQPDAATSVIRATANDVSGASAKNGAVRGAARGIFLGDHCAVSDLRVIETTHSGVETQVGVSVASDTIFSLGSNVCGTDATCP